MADSSPFKTLTYSQQVWYLFDYQPKKRMILNGYAWQNRLAAVVYRQVRYIASGRRRALAK